MTRPLLCLLLATLAGCGPGADPADDTGKGGDDTDSGTDDTGTDSGSTDSGSTDSGSETGTDSGGDTAETGDTGESGETGDTGDTDRDGDGAPDASDCAPDDAGVHPGAAERWCDGVDQDCDGADDTRTTLTGSDGVAVDVTADLAAGTESAPAVLGVTDATLRVCGGAWYAGAWLSGAATVEAGNGAVFRTGPSTAALQVGEGAVAVVSGLRVEGSYRGVSSTSSAGSLTLQDVELVGNTIGVLWSGGANLTLRDTRVAQSTTYGVWVSGGALVVEGGEIVDSGGVDAGGLSLANATATLTDTRLAGNHASAYAGGISAVSSSVSLSGVTLEDNQGSSGGAVYGYDAVIDVADSTLAGNAAYSGGALYLDGGSTLTARDTTMAGNTVTGDGGAMALMGSTSTVERVVLRDNVADRVSTVFAAESDETYVDTEFLDNVADYAPAHLGQSGTVSFRGGEFSRNAATLPVSGIGFATVLCGQDTSFDGVTVGSGADANSPAGFYDGSSEYFELTTVTTDCPNGECDIGSTVACGS